MIHETNDVATKSREAQAMAESLELTEALMGGTDAMRAAGPKYLPKWPAEEGSAHTQRLRLATLRPVYKRTVAVLVGKPMSKPITLDENFPESQKPLMDNIDRAGRNLDTFVADVLEVAIAHGQCHIFIDSPKAGPVKSIAQEKADGVRPYFVKVEPKQLLGWRYSDAGILTQVRYMETVDIPDGEYKTKAVKQIRVLEPTKWTLWRESENPEDKGWAVYEEGVFTMGEIPWVTVYGRRTGNMTSEPPMLELAHLNVKHWQSQSDQDNITHVVRVPILTVIGAEDQFTLVVGAQSAVKLPPNASMMFVEHSGAAVGVGKVSLDDLVDEMRQAGAEMLVVRDAQATATEVATDNVAAMSDLQRIVRGAQDAVNIALEFLSKWLRETKVGEVKIFNDFEASIQAEASAALVLQGTTAGLLSKETAFAEWQRRGIISGDLDYEEEQDRIEQEGPPQGNVDPVTGLPYDKPLAPKDPDAPKGKIDPHTGLPYDKPADPVAMARAKGVKA